jgi:ribosomal-protein-alanine N-acetyltransferase
MIELETDRLRIVALDFQGLARTLKSPLLDEELRAVMRDVIADIQEDPAHALWYTHWQIVQKARHVIIGGLLFKGPPDGCGEVEVGYGIDEAYQGQGYMTEALGAVVEWALAQPGVAAVTAQTLTDNAASQRVLEKADFTTDRAAIINDEGERVFVWRRES